QWLPSPHIKYDADVNLPASASLQLIGQELTVSLPETGGEAVPAQIAFDPRNADTTVTGMRISGSEPLWSIGGSRALASIRFGITNFFETVGTPIRDDEGHVWRGRIQLTTNGWSLTLDQRRDHREMVEKLRSNGGYGLTHVGELK